MPRPFWSLKVKISPPIIRSGVFVLSDQPWGQQSWELALLYSGQSQCPLTCGWPLLGEQVTSPVSILTPLLSHPFILFNQLSTSTIYSGIFQPPSHSARGQERHSKKFRAWLRMEKWVIVFLVKILPESKGWCGSRTIRKVTRSCGSSRRWRWNEWLPGPIPISSCMVLHRKPIYFQCTNFTDNFLQFGFFGGT